MTNSAHITLSGYVGTEPHQWHTSSHIPACSFRVGSTKRYFSTKDNQWKSSETTWVQVKAFRTLATNVMKSVKVGDPIIVSGTLTVDTWDKDGVTHTIPSIEAASIGHDLCMGSTSFTKNEPVNRNQNNAPLSQATVNGNNSEGDAVKDEFAVGSDSALTVSGDTGENSSEITESTDEAHIRDDQEELQPIA